MCLLKFACVFLYFIHFVSRVSTLYSQLFANFEFIVRYPFCVFYFTLCIILQLVFLFSPLICNFSRHLYWDFNFSGNYIRVSNSKYEKTFARFLLLIFLFQVWNLRWFCTRFETQKVIDCVISWKPRK